MRTGEIVWNISTESMLAFKNYWERKQEALKDMGILRL